MAIQWRSVTCGALLFLVVGLGIVACSGAKSSTYKTAVDASNETQVALATLDATLEHGNGSTVTPEPAARSCPPAGTYKEVGKTPQEAAINAICLQNNWYRFMFKNITSQSVAAPDGSHRADVTVLGVRTTCVWCPTPVPADPGFEFRADVTVVQNFDGDWQTEETEGGQIDLNQTANNQTAVASWNATSTATTSQALLSQVQVTNVGKTAHLTRYSELLDPGDYLAAVRMNVVWPAGIGAPFTKGGDIDLQLQGPVSGRTGSTWHIFPVDELSSDVVVPGDQYFVVQPDAFPPDDFQSDFTVLAYRVSIWGSDGRVTAVGPWVQVQ